MFGFVRYPRGVGVKAVISLGKRGRFRWGLYDSSGTIRSLCPVSGFDSYAEAVADLRAVHPYGVDDVQYRGGSWAAEEELVKKASEKAGVEQETL